MFNFQHVASLFFSSKMQVYRMYSITGREFTVRMSAEASICIRIQIGRKKKREKSCFVQEEDMADCWCGVCGGWVDTIRDMITWYPNPTSKLEYYCMWVFIQCTELGFRLFNPSHRKLLLSVILQNIWRVRFLYCQMCQNFLSEHTFKKNPGSCQVYSQNSLLRDV